MMIPAETILEIQRLLAEDRLSQRGIARRVGVSRGTVNAMALGRRPDFDSQRRQAEAESFEPARPAERCKTCGALLVVVPCVACRARKEPRGESEPGTNELALQLKPEHQARYQQVRRGAITRHYGQQLGVAAGPE